MPRSRNVNLLVEIGQRVAAARRDRGLTQEQLAAAIGIDPVTVSRWENGDRAVSLSTLANIADELDVGLGDLLDVERPDPTAEPGTPEVETLQLFRRLPEDRQDLLLRLLRTLVE